MILKLLKGEGLRALANEEGKFIKSGYELMAIETVLRDFCENCREEGHKLWSCPYMFNSDLQKRNAADKSIEEKGLCHKCGQKTHRGMPCMTKRIREANESNELHQEYYKMLKDFAAGN